MGNRPTISIYTDGGADPNPGDGGWGAVLLPPEEPAKEICGGEPKTTNNRMEMMAAIEALSALKKPHVIDLHTDSQYLKNGITKWISGWKRRGWKKSNGEPVLNEDLWRRLDSVTSKHEIRWHWVKGHSGDRWNERADQLATEGRQRARSRRGGKRAASDTAEPSVEPPRTPKQEVPEGAAQVYFKVCAQRGREGWAVGIRGLPKSRVLAQAEPRASSNLLGLLAIIHALEVVPKKQPVVIYARSDYLRLGATQWLVGWKKRGWKTKDGKVVSNRDAWVRLDALLQSHTVTWDSIPDSEIPNAELLESLALQAGEQRLRG